MKYVILLLISSNVFGMNKKLNSRRLERIIQQQTEMRRRSATKSLTQVTITRYSDTCIDQKTITTDEHIIIIDNHYEKITVFNNTSSLNDVRHLTIARAHQYYIPLLKIIHEIPFVQEKLREIKKLKTWSRICLQEALRPLDDIIKKL